jgi:hypothetical protein
MKRPDLPADHCANQPPEMARKMFVQSIAPRLKGGSMDARSAISELEGWREYHPEVFADWEGLCWKYLQQPPEWVDWLIQGVKVTSGKVTKADVLATVGKAHACADAALALQGAFADSGNPHGNLYNVKVTEQGVPGNSAAYLAARLKKANRDDLLKQIGPDKQYKSVRSAAIEAGIITPFPSLQLKEPAPTAQRLLTKKGKEWCLQLLDELSALVFED